MADDKLTPADMMRSAFAPFQNVHTELARMQDEVARLMEQFWQGAPTGQGGLPYVANLPAMRPAQPFAANAFATMTGLPPADVSETDEGFVISAELPGLSRDDVELTITDHVLTLAGEKREEKSDTRANFYSSERRYGRFQRSFPIPPSVQRDAISASFKDGVLTIRLPKSADSLSAQQRVEIRG